MILNVSINWTRDPMNSLLLHASSPLNTLIHFRRGLIKPKPGESSNCQYLGTYLSTRLRIPHYRYGVLVIMEWNGYIPLSRHLPTHHITYSPTYVWYLPNRYRFEPPPQNRIQYPPLLTLLQCMTSSYQRCELKLVLRVTQKAALPKESKLKRPCLPWVEWWVEG